MSRARAVNEAYRNTKAAAGRLQELFFVEERTARAMLTIAAELGEYQLNGIQVTGDDDAQEFIIRSLSQPPAAKTYPPGTPMVTNTREFYPAAVLTPPATVAGHRVLAWAESRRRDGEYPGGIVLAVSNPDRERHEYVTWNAYTKDGGQTWGAESGHYWTGYADAWDDFTERAQRRPATEY